MTEQQDPTSAQPTLRWIISIGLIAAMLAGAVFFLRQAPDDPREEQPQLSAERLLHLTKLAEVANAHLENLDLPRAQAMLQEVAADLPDEPLPIRNLAICNYLLLQQRKIGPTEVAASLARLREVEPQSPATYWLEGQSKLAVEAAPEEAVAAFLQATDLAQENAAFPYAAYEAAKQAADAQQQGFRLLQRAHELDPDNLFILGDWLVALAQAEDANLQGTLTHAMTLTAPLQAGLLKQHRVDIIDVLQQSQEAIRQGDWAMVRRNMQLYRNITRPSDFTQSDRRAVTPHPLEFMVHQFRESLQNQTAPSTSDPQLIDFEFAKADELAGDEAVRAVRLIDFDLDGVLEIVVLRQTRLEVYRRPSADTAWEMALSHPVQGDPRGLLAADLDRDRDYQVEDPPGADAAICFEADTDFVVYGTQGVSVLRNVVAEDGHRELKEVSQNEAVGRVANVTSAILLDFDHDSNLDIVCATGQGVVALLAQGDMLFDDVTNFSSLPTPLAVHSMAAVDWERDADIDIVLQTRNEAAGYLENLRHGNFRWRPFDSEYSVLKAATTLSVEELDGNVSWDLIGAGESGISCVLTSTPQPGSVQFQRSQRITESGVQGAITADVDNNGHQDVVAWSGETVTVWRGTPTASFVAMGDVVPGIGTPVTGCEAADLDQDGDLDLCILTADTVQIFSNEGGNQNHWLSLRAMGQVDNAGKANHNGIGSMIEVKAQHHYQAQVVTQSITHFGLGTAKEASVVRFLWTNGVPQAIVEPAANQTICEVMTLKGSCPYVYTWSGQRFEFFTDCLWAAPIGLQLAEDVLAPSRSWEYLRIPGNALQAKEGKYLLQVTEELWEAAYFDHVSLIAVDHPQDVEVYSNEKVGPPEIAAFKIHGVSKRRYPVAARDQQGRDVLPQIRDRDHQYLRGFAKTRAPGLAEPHFLELDLGQLESPRSIKLFLTGWIYPTDTSLNVALSRHPEWDGPKPPSILAPDASGEWREKKAYMGFPGGKTKTIVVDVSDVFAADDYRLRIATSAEIYWDEVFYTVDEDEPELRMQVLPLAAADLHFRGFSRSFPQASNGPETYDYANLTTAPKWPPMRGRFTRYGDVRELVADADDRMVVMGAGDEMTLAFAAGDSGPRPGWTRDFIMHNVGWDKDADLNTIYGQSVEPLPYRAMSRYPYGQDEQFPDTPKHREFRDRYLTRTQESASFWRQIRLYRAN